MMFPRSERKWPIGNTSYSQTPPPSRKTIPAASRRWCSLITIIILWADHGYHLGDKESCVKFTLWEKANRVPFIIVAPGVTRPGSRCDRPVSLIDIYPTLVELAGLPPKKGLDGKSLVPLLRDPGRQWQPALMTMGRGNHAVRSDRWRYIRYSDGSEELYDHSKDPWEWTNLAAQPEYAEVIDEHKKWLPTNEK